MSETDILGYQTLKYWIMLYDSNNLMRFFGVFSVLIFQVPTVEQTGNLWTHGENGCWKSLYISSQCGQM